MDLEKLYSIFYTSLKVTTISRRENQQKSSFIFLFIIFKRATLMPILNLETVFIFRKILNLCFNFWNVYKIVLINISKSSLIMINFFANKQVHLLSMKENLKWLTILSHDLKSRKKILYFLMFIYTYTWSSFKWNLISIFPKLNSIQ